MIDCDVKSDPELLRYGMVSLSYYFYGVVATRKLPQMRDISR